jgi:hypothetical protein
MTPFAKFHYELIEMGLPRTLVILYGVLEHMAGTKGECWPKQSTLAKRIGLTSARQVENLLNQLHQFRLIDWKRGRYYNRYRVLKPDTKWISDLTRNGFRISDPKRISDRKEPAFEKSHGSKPQRSSASQPTSSSVGEAMAGRLAALITEAWPKLPGHPGAKLIGDIADELRDIPLSEYRALLVSKARQVRSFGLALNLARDLRERRNGDARARKQHDVDKRDREDVQRDEQIKTLESMRDDPTHADDRAQIEAMLADLKRTPKSETTRARKGAA